MAQEITVTKVEDHHEMRFDGGDAYPVPTNAIDMLDDDLTPEEVGESVTFRGDYGGPKHCKTFDVEEVVDGLGDETESDPDDETDETSATEGDEQRAVADDLADAESEDPADAAEPTPEHVDEVGYHAAAGQAQQVEAQRLFSDGGLDTAEASEEIGQDDSSDEDDTDGQDDSGHMFASDDSECRHVDCEAPPDMAAECDTGQTKYYCEDHAGGRRAGHARVDDWRELE